MITIKSLFEQQRIQEIANQQAIENLIKSMSPDYRIYYIKQIILKETIIPLCLSYNYTDFYSDNDIITEKVNDEIREINSKLNIKISDRWIIKAIEEVYKTINSHSRISYTDLKRPPSVEEEIKYISLIATSDLYNLIEDKVKEIKNLTSIDYILFREKKADNEYTGEDFDLNYFAEFESLLSKYLTKNTKLSLYLSELKILEEQRLYTIKYVRRLLDKKEIHVPLYQYVILFLILITFIAGCLNGILK